MATSHDTMDFLLDQLTPLGNASAKKMFGEYCLYLAGTPVGFVCDDRLYLKPTERGQALLGRVALGSPYPRARPHLLITPDLWEDTEWLCSIVRTTARDLPQPKPTTRRSKA